MLGPSHTPKKFTAHREFTDREIAQEEFINALRLPQSSKDHEYRILNFYGVGGQGKTALCTQFCKKLKQEKYANAQIGWVRLDFTIPKTREITRALLDIRLQLIRHCQIPFPAFENAFARYFAFAYQGQNIRTQYPELFEQPSSVLQDIETISGDLLKEIPGIGFLYKYFQKLSTNAQKWWRQRGNAILEDLDRIEEHCLIDELPKYLGSDLHDWLYVDNSQPDVNQRRLVILLDAYEALWSDQPTKSGLNAMRVDAWVRKLIKESPGVLFVVLGRDHLGWPGDKWTSVIKPCLLGGLSREDADKFLQRVPIIEDDVRAAIIEASEGLPFYLNLQVGLYEMLKQKESHLSAHHFGGKEEDILRRFIDHLDENSRRALQIVSHARFLDEQLVHQLAEKFLGGMASIDFGRLVYYSFWNQEGKVWYLHALMRDYLQDRQRKDEPKLLNAIHRHLFEIYDKQLSELEQVVDITETHKQALIEAGYHLLEYEADRFPDWANERGKIFQRGYAWKELLPLYEKALKVAESLLGESHLDTATTLNELARLYEAQGKYEEAEPLYLHSLKIREQKLGKDHPHVATTLNNLARLYGLQGKCEEAEPMYLRSLKIKEQKLGKDHPDVATTLNNLAILYESQDKYEEAELLCLRSLKIREEKLGKDHPHVAISLNNLAGLYGSQSKYAEAESLYLRSLKIREQKLGKDHPRVAATLSNLAELYRLQGSYEEAEPLYLRSLAIREQKLGKDHPDVAQSLNSLATLYESQGSYEEAEPLYLRAIDVMEKAFPGGHPNLDLFKANYADLKNKHT